MTAIGHSARSRGIPLQSCMPVPRHPSTPLRFAQDDVRPSARLFFNNLDILDHGNAATLFQLALDRDRLAAVLGELIVDGLMFANYDICFSFADDTDSST